ncbi:MULTISPECIES: ABC transporter ATP-binding protein [unclassified Viridibacillus]|uniref:ABC transporter ATP-binding protein n=1 Tax=unclassified Viridibacillus TaxID=2617942 RepID=UPI0030F66154
MNSIEVKGLSKKYKEFQIEDVSLTLPRGVIMGFIGENGAGKTTTIKCILNLLQNDTGEIRLFGKKLEEAEIEIKEEIGVVFDDILFPEPLNPTKINHFMKKLYKNWDVSYYFELLEKFHVPLKKTMKELSRGMRMKLSIAVALAHHPKLLILDEPTSGLDPIVRDEILELFQDFMQDKSHSILFSSHITTDLEKIADYITFIHEGKIQFSEEKDYLLEEYAIFRGDDQELKAIPPTAIKGIRRNAYSVEALVKRSEVNTIFSLEKPTIEEVMLFTVKGGALK